MFVQEEPKPRQWPKWGYSPQGKRARIDCEADLPKGWSFDEPAEDAPVKRGPGRPKKAA